MAIPEPTKYTAIISNETSIDLSVTDKFVESYNQLKESKDFIKIFSTEEELRESCVKEEINEILIDSVFDTDVNTALLDWIKDLDNKINIVFRYTDSSTYTLIDKTASTEIVDDRDVVDKYRLSFSFDDGAVITSSEVAGNKVTIALENEGSIEFSDGNHKMKLFLDKI